MLKIGQSISTTVDKLVDGGAGLGRVDGQAVFIPGVCPGEEVRATVAAVKGGYADAALDRVLTASPERVMPPCPVFGRCGGCQWQQLAYPAQVASKVAVLREDLERIGKLADAPILPSIAAPSPFGYRARVQFKVDGTHAVPSIGFFAAGSRRLVPVDRCEIAAPRINEAMLLLRTLLSEPDCRLPSLTELHLHDAPSTGELQVRYMAGGEPKKRVEKLLKRAAESVPGLVSQVYYDQSGHRRVFGRDWITERVRDRPFRISDRSFAQVNWAQNSALIDTVETFASLQSGERLLELYCGIGNFGLFLSGQAARVMGIDENKTAINDARHNATAQGIANCRFDAKPVGEAVQQLVAQHQTFNCLVLDPPRPGVERPVLDNIVALRPERIVYVSCVPSTLARDLRRLADAGYRARRIQPVDLFPQTPYLETVTEFTAVS